MKRLLLLQILFFSFFVGHGQGIQRWFEDFEGEANGATSGTAAGTPGGTWSVTTTPSGGAASFSRQNYFYNRFSINQTGNEGVWASSVVDISSTGQAALDISLVSYYGGSGDYVRAYYKLNGGAEVLFGEALGQTGAYNITSQASIVLTGTSVQIIVRGMENTAGSTGGYPNMMRVDDVEITQVSTLYSRNGGGNWGTSGTWSTVALNGVSCACTPDNTTNVVVGNSDVVSITGASSAINITVQNSSTLRWTTNNVALNVSRGGSVTVSNTAQINHNGNTGASIVFPVAAAVGLTVNSSNANALLIGDISITGAPTLTISGTGNITTADDFLVSSAATITNSLTGTLTITDDLNFNTTNATFTNNRTLTAGDLIVNDNADDGNTFTNASTGTLTVATINTNSANFTLNNSGTINQTSNFVNSVAGSSFNNLNGSTWNFAGTTFANARLFCNNGTNTFNYNLGGDQSIITPQDAYSNLTLSNSGIKTMQAAFAVNGNLSISGLAQFDVTTFNRALSVGGNWTVTSTNADPFAQRSGVLTFNGSGNQTLSTVLAGGETFHNVVVNKPGGSLNLSSNFILGGTTGTGLTLTQGVINSSSSAMVIVNNGVTTNSGDADSFVDGPIQRVGSTAYTFPTGDGTVWARIAVVPTGVSTFTAQYFFSPYSSLSNDGSMDNASGKEYWTLDRTAGGNATVQLFWESNTRSEIDDITTTDLIVARYNGTNWTSAGRSAISSLPITTGSVTSSAVSSFSPFTFGSLGYPNNPLPVLLNFFDARLENDKVNLTWETASELNNDFFTIEKTSDLESFEEVVKRDGQGTTHDVHRYSAVDYYPYFGRSYYRLRQTDFDGKFTFSNIQVIDYTGTSMASLHAYPSPSEGKRIVIEVRGLEGVNSMPVQLINMKGQRILEQTFEVKTPGLFKEELEMSTPLPVGVYIIKAGPTLLLTQKIVVE